MWPTPTPFPTPVSTPSLGIDPSKLTGDVSNGILQVWHFFDSSPIGTIVWFIALATLIIVGLLSIRRHLESL